MSHLNEIEWGVTQSAKGNKPCREYKFVIEFGLHCFTRRPNFRLGETLKSVERALHYSDTRETRLFCFYRYQLSKKLPGIVREVNNRPCYHTGKGNFFIIEMLNDEGLRGEYEVYFQISRAQRGVIRMFVQSAYIRDNQHSSSQPRKNKINFFVIAHNTLMKKEIKIPK